MQVGRFRREKRPLEAGQASATGRIGGEKAGNLRELYGGTGEIAA